MEERKFGGAIPSPKDNRDYKIETLIAGAPQDFIPAYYKTTIKIPRLDQGKSSECVACSLSYIKYIQEQIESGKAEQLSPSYIYGNREEGMYQGEGMIPREALKTLLNYGTTTWNIFPNFYSYPEAKQKYNQNKDNLNISAKPFKIKSYYAVMPGNELKTTIMNLGAVSAMFPVFECLYRPDEEGKIIYDCANAGEILGYHQMTIIGWTETAWIVLNSWGENWGDNGICYIPFDYPIVEAWALIDEKFIKSQTSKQKKTNFITRIIEFFSGKNK